MKDGRHGTVIAHGVDGPYAVDVGGGSLVPILDHSPIHPERDARNWSTNMMAVLSLWLTVEGVDWYP
jgi:hypothetical protein